VPRANRYFLPNHVWHLTHRCHEKASLFKFARDREFYLRWLFEAKKRFGLCVLNYMVTSNHVHLLVQDTGEGVIARGMLLAAGCTAQEYNRRKARQGAFWEDRYHATAVENGEHLIRCLVYIDLNMVRAGVVRHPGEWGQSGYQEIQSPPERYSIIDLAALGDACGIRSTEALREAHRQWVNEALAADSAGREERWSESVAVGSAAYVETVKRELDLKARKRRIAERGGAFALREPAVPYRAGLRPTNTPLRQENALYWK
jgi:putative transposase